MKKIIYGVMVLVLFVFSACKESINNQESISIEKQKDTNSQESIDIDKIEKDPLVQLLGEER